MTDLWATIDRIAAKLGATERNRAKWRQRGVPHRWRLPILQAAAKAGILLDASAFEARAKRKSAPRKGRRAESLGLQSAG
jgi:hypothetical protein